MNTRVIALVLALPFLAPAGCDWGGDSSREPVVAAPPARADSEPIADPQAAPDIELVERATRANMAEVQLGMLAADRARHEDVRIYGLRMITEHTQAGEDLRAIALSKGVKLPGNLGAEHLAVRERLVRLRGDEFDREFMTAMVSDHRDAISVHQRLAREARDPDIRAYAVQTLPILRIHLEEAEAVLQRLHGPAPAGAMRY